jgi:hypothetical protein
VKSKLRSTNYVARRFLWQQLLQILTFDVEHRLARDLAKFVGGAKLVLARVLRLGVHDQQYDNTGGGIVTYIVSLRRVDLSGSSRPLDPRRWVRLQLHL